MHMAPKHKARPIPIGWTLETEVKKDGSKISVCKNLLYIFFIFLGDLIEF